MNTPVLMVHGMCCTGEVWTQFRSFFEARGAKVYTPTLRPELRVSVRARAPRALRDVCLMDYVADLEREIDHIEQETGMTPCVIGHSMGGLLAQALTARGRVSAGVFISPAAPAGIRTFQSNIFWTGFSIAHRFGWTPKIVRPDQRTINRAVVNVMPEAERAAILEAMVHESGRVFSEFAGWHVDHTTIRVPVLVVGAGRDRLVPAALVRLTGRKYAAVGGEYREYPNHGHWLYAEPGWEKPAADIYEWLAAATVRASIAPRVAAVDAQSVGVD
jgi:alpha-beta hydrolase superfamily lysophospholipase